MNRIELMKVILIGLFVFNFSCAKKEISKNEEVNKTSIEAGAEIEETTENQAKVKKEEQIHEALTKTELKKFFVQDAGYIDNCEKRGLKNKIVFYGSRTCPYCNELKPILENLVKKYKLEKQFKSFDLAEQMVRQHFEECNCKVGINFVPVTIINCEIVPGKQPEETYERLFEKLKAILKS